MISKKALNEIYDYIVATNQEIPLIDQSDNNTRAELKKFFGVEEWK